MKNELLKTSGPAFLYALDVACTHVRLEQVDGPELWSLEITTPQGVIRLGIYGTRDWEPVLIHIVGDEDES